MLTNELVKPFLKREGSVLTVRELDTRSVFYQRTAQELIALFQRHLGQTRGAWQKAVEAYEGTRIDYQVIRGLAKVLSSEATFTSPPVPLPPVELRRLLFSCGPVFPTPDIFHQQRRQEVVEAVARDLGTTAELVEGGFYADLEEEQVLTELGPAWSAQTLLARYNLELARGVLFNALNLQIEVYSHYKDLWHYIKFFRLMFDAEPIAEGGYRVTLDGPISPFMKGTKRYGLSLASFMPAVLLCERWQLKALVRAPLWPDLLTYQLNHTCSLVSHFRASGEHDSLLEKRFAEEFSDFIEKFGEKRGRWHLQRESEVLLIGGDTVMIPDFLAVHESDPRRTILIELVGFWHPNYLKRKQEKIRAAGRRDLLLLVYEGLNVTKEQFAGVPSGVVFFQRKPVIKEILPVIEQMAESLYGPLPARSTSVPEEQAGSLLEQLVSTVLESRAGLVQEWLPLTELGSILVQHDPSFTPRKYGKHRTLSALVSAHTELFEMCRSTAKGRPILVRFRIHREAGPAFPIPV